MAVSFFDDRVEITLDEFFLGLSPAVFEQTLREMSLPVLGLEVRGQRDADGRLTSGSCVVLLRRPLERSEQQLVGELVETHLGGDPLQLADPRVADLAGQGFGASTIVYVRRAPKEGESPDSGTGTHVYRDPDGNWRRLTDDAVLRRAEARP
ncbi:MAG: hypothetical protein B7733_18655 [Myxococcales bacterium FL481]|nr:MAG: hypothetical protein B7733_18655 [Myxococcales bacterium FL481]